jgi:hypothetical protein
MNRVFGLAATTMVSGAIFGLVRNYGAMYPKDEREQSDEVKAKRHTSGAPSPLSSE